MKPDFRPHKGALPIILASISLLFFIASRASGADPGTGIDRIIFPGGNVFQPLVADPKEPQFFFGLQQFDATYTDTFTAGSVGVGETFGIIRQYLGEADHAWQLNLKGGIFSQFNLDAPSDELVNTDFAVGGTLTYQYKSFSTRFRMYHQSSHVGDEYLVNHPDMLSQEFDFNYEAADWLGAVTWDGFRFYAGPHFLLRSDPDMDRWGYQTGLEFRTGKPVVLAAHYIFGADVKGYEALDWEAGVSVKTGLEWANLFQTSRCLKFMLEYYDGFYPYGQFFTYDLTSYGFAFYLGF